MTESVLASAASNLVKGVGLETPLNIVSCIGDLRQCSFNIAISVLSRETFYQIPQNAVWLGKEAFRWSADCLSRTSPHVARINDAIANTLQPPLDVVDQTLQKGDSLAKSLIIPTDSKTAAEIAIEQKMAGKEVGSGSSFSAFHLVGAALLSGKCAKKSLENLASAVRKFRRLITLQREVATVYPTADSAFNYTKTKRFTACGLIWESSKKLGFSLAWGSASLATTLGMIDALEKAGASNPILTASLATALSTAAFVMPTVIGWIQRYRASQASAGEESANVPLQEIRSSVPKQETSAPPVEWDEEMGKWKWKEISAGG